MNLCSQCGVGDALEEHAPEIIEDLNLSFKNFKMKIDKLDGLNWACLAGGNEDPLDYITNAMGTINRAIEKCLVKYPNDPDKHGWLSYMAKGILNIRHVYLYNESPMEGVTLRYGNNSNCGSEYEEHPTQIPNRNGRLIFEHKLGGYVK